MIVKLTVEQLALIGATTAEDFASKLESYCANVGKIEASMPKLSTENTDLKATLQKIEGALLTEASVKTIIASDVPGLAKAYLASDEGKALIKAESSRVFLEAHAGTGTAPLKPSPAPADPALKVTELLAAGDFEAAYAASKDLQAEFPNAKVFAAYARAEHEGRVLLNKPTARN